REEPLEELAVLPLIVHDEDAVDRLAARDAHDRPQRARDARGRIAETHRDVERERRSFARAALQTDLSAQERDERPADREPEPGPLLCSPADLHEGLEELRLLLRADPGAGVRDLEAEPYRALFRLGRAAAHAHLDAPLGGELARVAD